jgi:anti-sigma regulatory factor (Ser/Thr protein kinase)
LREIALHLLDIAENSVAAGATSVAISVEESSINDSVCVVVQDDGRGMDAQTLERLDDPFFTSRTTRKVGLGIPLLKAAAEASSGWLTVDSTPGRGTRLETMFRRSHIDRMPIGDLAGTWLLLLVGFPSIRWQLSYQLDGREFEFDSRLIQSELAGLSLSEPVILSYLRETLEKGVQGVQRPSP